MWSGPPSSLPPFNSPLPRGPWKESGWTSGQRRLERYQGRMAGPDGELERKREGEGMKVKLLWGEAWSSLNGAVQWLRSLALQRAYCKRTTGTMHGAPGTSRSLSPSLFLCLSLALSPPLLSCDLSQTLTYRWTNTFSLPMFLPRLNRLLLSSNTIRQLAVLTQCYMYFRESGTEREREEKKEFPVFASHPACTYFTEITVQHHAEFKQWGNSAGDSVTSDSDRLWFSFFPFCFYFSVLTEWVI